MLCCLGMAAASGQEQTFNQAVAALQRSDYPAAEAGFSAVLQSEPRNSAALGNLAVVYSRTYRFAQAVSMYLRALALDPNNPSLLLNLGLAYLKEEHYADALPRFLAVEKQQPENFQAAELVATCLVFLGRESEAITRLNRLRQSDPNRAAVLYLLGVAHSKAHRPELAHQLFTELLSSGVPPVQANFLLGKASYEGGDFAGAQPLLEAALFAQPDFAEARLTLARVFISLRENDRAARQLTDLLRSDPQNPDANYLLGTLLVTEEKYAAAIPYLDRAGQALSDSWALAFYRGKAALKTGHPADAVPLLRRSLELNPDGEQTYYLLAQALRAAGRPAEAKAALDQLRTLKSHALQREQNALAAIPPAH